MDRSEVKRIVERELDPLTQSLGIGHWTITVRFDLRDGDGEWESQGRVRMYVDYDKAMVLLDPDALDDEAAVIRVLRHELLHVVLAPFDVLYNAMAPLIKKDETLASVFESIHTNVVEQAVINLERLYKGLTTNPAKKEPRPMVAPKKAKKPAEVKPVAEAPTPTPQARKSPKPAARKAKSAKS